jgi:hypothetical protein
MSPKTGTRAPHGLLQSFRKAGALEQRPPRAASIPVVDVAGYARLMGESEARRLRFSMVPRR